ncbi:N-acetylmuramoyl-L-alanine amidase [Thermophilibacter sp.]
MRRVAAVPLLLAAALALGGCGCAGAPSGERDDPAEAETPVAESEPALAELPEPDLTDLGRAVLLARLDLVEDIRPEFDHGPKDAVHQRYIVLHDTEGTGSPESVVSWWSSSGNLVAAHFVVGTDGHIVQCVPLDRIAHHAGYGDTGHNELFDITEDGRDDMLGSVPIGASFADYGMNAWSVGIELVHVGGSGDYPEAQLEALDGLIAYIDAYYGFESQITDHKAWRSGNSDTSAEFAGYLANYQDHRTHD